MMNREHVTLRQCRLVLACALAASTSLFACSEDAVTAPAFGTDDPIAAYEALSTQLEACEDEQASCLAAAGGEATALARCEAAAESCKAKAAPAEARAKDSLRRGANRCRDEDDAGVADEDDAGPGRGDMGGCIERRFPNLRRCVGEFVACLDAAGFLRQSAQPDSIEACFDDAHTCFIEELSAWRDSRRNRNPDEAGAGGTGATSGAAAAGGGSSRSDDGEDEADRGERGRRDGPFDRRRPRRGRSD